MPDRSDMNADPLADRLGRFTPDAAGLDRATILFQAGRASARGWRLWPALAGLLCVTQAVTLVLLFNRPSRPEPLAPEAARQPEWVEPAGPVPDVESSEPGQRVVRVRQSGGSLELPPEMPEENLVAAGPPLDVLAVSAGLRNAHGPQDHTPE